MDIVSLGERMLSALLRGEVWGVFSTLVLLALPVAVTALGSGKDADRRDLVAWLRRPLRAGLYERLARWMIDRLDSLFLGSGGGEGTRRPIHRYFDSCVRLAFLYPLVLWLIDLIAREPFTFPAGSGVPEDVGSLAMRMALLAALPANLMLAHELTATWREGRAVRRWRSALAACAVIFPWLVAIPLGVEVELAEGLDNLLPFAVPAFMAMVLGFPAGLGVVAYAAAFGLLFNLASWIAGQISLDGASPDTIGWLAPTLHWIAFTVSLGVGFGLFERLTRPGARPARLRLWYGIAFAALVAALLAVAAIMIRPPLASEGLFRVSVAMLVMFGAFPLLNAVFDFLSLLATRLLVSIGLADLRLAPLMGLLDAMVAVVLLAALGAACVATLQLLNALHGAFNGGRTLINIGGVLHLFSTREGTLALWWLIAAMFSTMVPTLLHAGIGLFAAVAWLPRRFRIWLACQIRRSQRRTTAYYGALAGLCLVGATYLAMPLAALWALALNAPFAVTAIGAAYLAVIKWVAVSLGVPLMPAPG